MSSVLTIRLYPPWATCWWCGAETCHQHGLPVDDTGELVANDFKGEWAGVPSCERCYLIHQAGGPELLERTVPRGP